MIRRYLSLIIFSLFVSNAIAQDLWISGTAVPGGTQKLTQLADGDYKYAGRLNAGELRIMSTRKASKQTTYLVATVPDANIVNNGLAYVESKDAKSAAWQVLVSDSQYRFHLNTQHKQLRGEIVLPWGELFIAGGATEVGWKSEGKMLLMQQSIDNPYVWTWEGELKRHPEVEEPTSFKFQGQDRWYPKAIHPHHQGTDILKDKTFRTGGNDTKWEISRDGRYHITVDLFNETVHAELVK